MKGLNLLMIIVMLAFYCLGAGVMDSFVIYHGWLFVGDAEFALVHRDNGQRIVPFFVLPMLVNTVLTVLLLWFRPAAVSKKYVWLAIGLQSIGWLSSAFIQIPIQLQLDNGKDMELLQKLIVTDWIRVVAHLVSIGVMIAMVRQALFIKNRV